MLNASSKILKSSLRANGGKIIINWGGAYDLWDFKPMYDLKQCVLIVLEFAIKANSKTTSLYYQI